MTIKRLAEENQLLKQRLLERDEKIAQQAEIITKLETSRKALKELVKNDSLNR